MKIINNLSNSEINEFRFPDDLNLLSKTALEKRSELVKRRTGRRLGKVLSGINNKGGVGKSTVVMETAFNLWLEGNEILLIDADPQANCTKWFFDTKVNAESIYDVAVDKSIGMEDVTFQITEGFMLTPASKKIELMNDFFAPKEWIQKIEEVADVNVLPDSAMLDNERKLLTTIESVKEHFDYVIIDTRPSLGRLNRVIHAACDHFIIVTEPDEYAYDGLLSCYEEIESTFSKIGKKLDKQRDTTVVINKYYGDEFDDEYVEKIYNLAQESVSEAVYPYQPRYFKFAKKYKLPFWAITDCPNYLVEPSSILAREISHKLSRPIGRGVQHGI